MNTRAFVFLSMVCAVTALAQPDLTEIGTSEVPGWVRQLTLGDFETDRQDEFQFGVAILLDDRQVRKTDGGYEYVQRYASRIIDRSGLEAAATILHSFDPASETISFNFVRIIRDGQVIDRLLDTEITLLRQEEQLPFGIIDGNVSAMMQLADVRVGDVIDYSITGSVVSELWPDEIFEAAAVERTVPLAESHFRLVVPATMSITTRGIATEVEPEVSTEGNWKSYSVHLFDPDPVPLQQNVAADWVTHGFIAFTTMEAWSDIVDWALPIFSFDEPLPADFVQKLDAIAAAYTRPQDRAIQTLRLVQSEIRYLGLELGLGTHVPRSPAETIGRGYGDCKDKAVLLVEALDYLGIPAVPALASLSNGEMLPQFPPMIAGFDHVVVEIDLGDRKLWVDPTLSHQGGNSESFSSLGYGYILPIRIGQTELVALEDPLPAAPIFEVIETFEFPGTGDVGMRISLDQVFRGRIADAMRFDISSSGRELIDRGFLDYYSAVYGQVTQAAPLVITDELESNEIRFRSQYEMDSVSAQENGIQDELVIYPYAVQNFLPRQVEANRTAPIALPHGTNTRHVARIVMPGQRFPLPEGSVVSAEGVSYSRNFHQDGDTVELQYSLVVDEASAEASAIAAVIDVADEIAQDEVITVRLQSALPTASRRYGLTTQMTNEMESFVDSIDALIAQRESIEALTALNEMLSTHTERDEARGVLQLQKGTALLSLRRVSAAIEAFEEAFALFEPPAVEHYLFFIGLLVQEGEDSQAARLAIRMFERKPEAPERANVDWFRESLGDMVRSKTLAERDTLVLAVARAMKDSESDSVDDYQWVVTEAIKLLAREPVDDELSEYLRLIKSPSQILHLLTTRETEAIWTEIQALAGDGLSAIIAEHVQRTREAAAEFPNDYALLREHVQALRMAGRVQEAIDFALPIANNWAQIEAVGRDAYWFINEYAYALSDSGDPEAATALMSRLLDLGVSQNPELISMAINRASTLMEWGEFEEALRSIDEIENLNGDYASDFGWMWIYSVEACSLHQLGRAEDAAAVVSDSIMPIADTNPAAYTLTMLCIDRFDDAAETIIARLASEDRRRSTVDSFVRPSIDVYQPPFQVELRRRAEQVKARSDVQDALNAVGRAITIDGTITYWGQF